MNIHSAHDAPVLGDGRCAWRWHFEDVDLWCSDDAIPGGDLCAGHLIRWAHARADAGIPPATPPAVAAESRRGGRDA